MTAGLLVDHIDAVPAAVAAVVREASHCGTPAPLEVSCMAGPIGTPIPLR